MFKFLTLKGLTCLTYTSSNTTWQHVSDWWSRWRPCWWWRWRWRKCCSFSSRSLLVLLLWSLLLLSPYSEGILRVEEITTESESRWTLLLWVKTGLCCVSHIIGEWKSKLTELTFDVIERR